MSQIVLVHLSRGDTQPASRGVFWLRYPKHQELHRVAQQLLALEYD